MRQQNKKRNLSPLLLFFFTPHLFTVQFTLIMESNHQKQEEEECSICLDSLLLNDPTKLSRATCCGKGMHIRCRDGVRASTMSAKQKNQCVMCRTKYPRSAKGTVDQLRPWVEKGKAWAQNMLGDAYEGGGGVDQSYQRAAELYELSASQGNATAQYNLAVMYRDGQGVNQSDQGVVTH